MDQSLVERVRRFNRTVTQQVGALQDRYLARDRSLGEARVLWEIGEPGCDIRELRARLDLDSGYLSRLLRALEGDALITLGASSHDRRVRTARLTRKGLASVPFSTAGATPWRNRCSTRSPRVARSGWWLPWERWNAC